MRLHLKGAAGAGLLVMGGLLHAWGSFMGYGSEPETLLWSLSASLAAILLAVMNLLRIGRPADDFQLPMSRDEIARYLGLALETVSRSFSRLHEEGIIEVRGRRIRVLDAKRLHAAASGCEADNARAAKRSRA